MPQIINVKSEIIRINPDNNTIEYSQNGGRSWILRYSNSFCGIFYDLFLHGSEILACTSKGLYYSSNEGRSWIIRYSGTICGTFQQLSFDGKNLLAITSKGLFYSTNAGRSWIIR